MPIWLFCVLAAASCTMQNGIVSRPDFITTNRELFDQLEAEHRIREVYRSKTEIEQCVLESIKDGIYIMFGTACFQIVLCGFLYITHLYYARREKMLRFQVLIRRRNYAIASKLLRCGLFGPNEFSEIATCRLLDPIKEKKKDADKDGGEEKKNA